MVSFLAVFLIAFIKQLVVYVVFAACNSYGGDIVVIIPTILLIGYLILYFTSTDKICKLIKIDKKKYDTYGCISWILSAILQFILSDIDFIWKALPKSGGIIKWYWIYTCSVLFSGISSCFRYNKTNHLYNKKI